MGAGELGGEEVKPDGRANTPHNFKMKSWLPVGKRSALLLNETSIGLLLNVSSLLAFSSVAVGAASPSLARLASSTTDKFSAAERARLDPPNLLQ